MNNTRFHIFSLKLFLSLITLFNLLTIKEAFAEMHPLLLKDEAAMHSDVYFGMSIDEFKSKLSSRIFECKDQPNKALADQVCKISFTLSGIGMVEGVVTFKDSRLIAIVGRMNSELFSNLNSEFNKSLKDNPQIENRDEKKGFFSKKINNQYAIWSYPNYLMLISQFDIPRYEENGTNFSLIIETSDSSFINQFKQESKKRSNIDFQMKSAGADFDKIFASKAEANKSDNTAPVTYSGGGYSPVSTVNNNSSKDPIQKTIGGYSNRSLLPSEISYGASKEQIKSKVVSCSSSDSFFNTLRKAYPKFSIDEYCVGTGLLKDINAETIFFIKDTSIKVIVHRAAPSEFQKLVNLYKTTIGNEPKDKKSYQAKIPVDCFFDEGLSDYAEFCRQSGESFMLTAGSAKEVNLNFQNRAKLIGLIKNFKISPMIIESTTKEVATTTNEGKDKKGKSLEQKTTSEKIVKSNIKWSQEPQSFIGIAFNEPLISSIDEQCPSTSGRLCYNVLRLLDSKYLEIKNPPIPKFRDIYITGLGENEKDPNSKVGRIEVSFNTDDFSEIKEILVQKYGPPHSNETGIVKTNGGAEFNNYQSYWFGNNVSIVIESLVSRGYTSGRYGSFYSYGTLIFTTEQFLKQKGDARESKVKNQADRL